LNHRIVHLQDMTSILVKFNLVLIKAIQSHYITLCNILTDIDYINLLIWKEILYMLVLQQELDAGQSLRVIFPQTYWPTSSMFSTVVKLNEY
jgi:hypothetical protein